MLTTMRRIGNSRGVLIPAAFLATCQIEDQVDMQLQDGHIVIKPVRRRLREGWFADTGDAPPAAFGQEQAEAHDWLALPSADDGEWVW
jgi:antitoxin MazE